MIFIVTLELLLHVTNMGVVAMTVTSQSVNELTCSMLREYTISYNNIFIDLVFLITSAAIIGGLSNYLTRFWLNSS